MVRRRRPSGSVSRSHTLVIGPWEGRGGIVSVMQLHRQTAVWDSLQCRELSTFREGTWLQKIAAALKAYWSAARLIPSAKLLHVHLSGATSCLRKLPFIAYGRLLRKPVIVHVHAASVSSLKQPGFVWAVRSAFKMATCVVVLSSSWAKELRQMVGNTRIVVIPNPVKVPNLTEMHSAERTRPVILFSGKLEQRKGYHLLLEAARSLIEEFPNLEIWLAGNGDRKAATELAEKLGIIRSVRILGWVATPTMSALLRTATIFCLPSYNEGVPMAVLEAMSHSLPVVTTPVGGLPDLIVHGKNGLFCDVGSVESLRANLSLLLHDERLRSDIGRQAAITVNRECGLDRVSRDLDSLYRAVLVRHRNNFIRFRTRRGP
jgi:glycosyltransferase involved in cell wall biosynthesis